MKTRTNGQRSGSAVWLRRLKNLPIEVDAKIEEKLSGATHRQATTPIERYDILDGLICKDRWPVNFRRGFLEINPNWHEFGCTQSRSAGRTRY